MHSQNLYQRLLSSPRFFLLAGPCVVENRDVVLQTASYLQELCHKLGILLIFKSSYRKANRSRLDSFQGIGDEAALKILQEVRSALQLPVVTDIHQPADAATAAECADILQIPAFLCRQTDLLTAAAATGRIVNVKKGQFLAPESMQFVANKVAQSGNNQILLTDRGTMFGYNDLIVDFRSIPRMQQLGYPVIMDVTHSLQQPNTANGVTGGYPQEIGTIAAATIAVGADGLFMETHPEPAKALSDGANMLPLHLAEGILTKLIRIQQAIKE